MKVRITTISLIAVLLMMLAAVGVAQATEELPVIRVEVQADLPEGYWDYLCPTGSKAVLDVGGWPLLDEDCVVEYLDGGQVIENTGDQLFDEPKVPAYYEKCVVCQQQVTEITETATVQQDAYTAAATTTRSSMPSTGMFLLPAAGLLAAGAGVLLARKRN